MKYTLIIHDRPTARINPALAKMLLIGIAVDLRPELLQWTQEPVEVTQGDYYYIHNDDLRAALTAQVSAAVAQGLSVHLPTDRVTSIERGCCTLRVAKTSEEIKA